MSHPPVPITAAVLHTAEVVVAAGSVRPFLKWAGGKRQLIPQLRRFVPRRFGQYFEPFVGSGALFFDLASRHEIERRCAHLTDINRDLLGTYCAIARNPEAVIDGLQEHERHHRASPLEYFYRVRDVLFNPRRSPLFDVHPAAPIEEYSPSLAAMFIYLNRTGFNGLFRLNSRGAFNVPAGRYANPRICDADNIRAVGRVIASSSVKIRCGSFESVLDDAQPGDFLYFDPPYAPVSATASFTRYTAFGFSDGNQRRLQEVVIELARGGCHVAVSNSTAPIIRQLYQTSRAARSAGLRVHKVAARRAINSKATGRGEVAEFIISNVTPPD